MNLLLEAKRMILHDGTDQLFIGTVTAYNASGAAQIRRPKAAVSDERYYSIIGVRPPIGGQVLVARVGEGAYVLVSLLNEEIPYRLVTVTDDIETYDSVVLVNSASPVTVTLPSGLNLDGKVFHVKRVGAGAVTIATTGSDTIDGGASISIAKQYESYMIVCQAGSPSAYHIV